MTRIDIQLKEEDLSAVDCLRFIEDPKAGGNVVFIGTVRMFTGGKEVIKLEFEAFGSMARKKMQEIAEQVSERWDAIAVSMHHRTGTLSIGDIPVIIAIATPHRKAAFEACTFAIDSLKESVPIWKKEFFEDGEVWVGANP